MAQTLQPAVTPSPAMLFPADMIPLLPTAVQPKPNAFRPRGSLHSRLATPSEVKARKPQLFKASSIEELAELGFKHILTVPESEAMYGEHDLWLEAADGSRAVHVLFVHPACFHEGSQGAAEQGSCETRQR